MQITSERKLLFQLVDYKTDPKSKVINAHVKERVLVSPGPKPQIVPDWVKNDELFKLAVEDGTVSEVNVVERPAKAKATTPGMKVPAAVAPVQVAQVVGIGVPAAGWPNASVDGLSSK